MAEYMGGRRGVPTIITPVFADQESNAAILKRSGCTLTTSKLGDLKSGELAAAIKRICEEPSFTQKSQELGKKMQQETGIKTSIEFIERFMRDEVKTGKYGREERARIEEFRKQRAKNEKLSGDQFQSKIMGMVSRRYPTMQAWNRSNMMFATECKDLVTDGKLYVVDAKRCGVRQGEDLKSEEVGKYEKSTIVKELKTNKKGSRMHVQKVKGWGPDEGWISPTVSGNTLLRKINDIMELSMIQAEKMNALFSDILPSA